MNTILLAYDGSEQSARALERAAELAKALTASCTSRASSRSSPAARGAWGRTTPPTLRRRTPSSSSTHEPGSRSWEWTRCSAPAHGDPADAILRLADEIAADLIVLGSHERSLVEHALGMSVSGAVTRRAHRDVLVAH